MTIRHAYEAIARDQLRKNDIQLTGVSMEFDEWWFEHGSGIVPVPGHDMEEHANVVARFSWEAATATERERCARIAEGVEQPGERHWIKGSLYDMLRRETAAEIRREP